MPHKYENDGRLDPSQGREPTRPVRLRAYPVDPPPLPPTATGFADGAFGQADEDGLRMLAALGTMTSLEPDYGDDFAAEASVTIMESSARAGAGWDTGPDDARRLRERCAPEPDLLLNGYETFLAFGEEATVEIIEVTPSFACREAVAQSPPPEPASLAERLAAAGQESGRPFKASSAA